jgi:hypothetical protein
MADDINAPRKPDLDPIRLIVAAEENLTGFRQNLILQVWETAVKASETATPGDLDALVRLHAAIKAIDFALANKPSVYREAAPI